MLLLLPASTTRGHSLLSVDIISANGKGFYNNLPPPPPTLTPFLLSIDPCNLQGGLGTVAAALLCALHASGGIEAARGLYRALLPLPPPGGDFFRCLLRLEVQHCAAVAAAAGTSAATASGDNRSSPALTDRQLTDLFEAASDAYGQHDVQLWLLYAEWQASRGSPNSAAAVYWKARKALRSPEELDTAWQLRFKLQPAPLAA